MSKSAKPHISHGKSKPAMKSKEGDNNAVIGSFKDQSPVPDKVREVMRANSHALTCLTMKSPC
jgi:hypothetical protein